MTRARNLAADSHTAAALESSHLVGHIDVMGRPVEVRLLPGWAAGAGIHGAYSSNGVLFLSPHGGHRGMRSRVHELLHCVDELSALHLSHDQVRALSTALTTIMLHPTNAHFVNILFEGKLR